MVLARARRHLNRSRNDAPIGGRMRNQAFTGDRLCLTYLREQKGIIDSACWTENDEMDDDNFQAEVGWHPGSEGVDDECSLHDVWSLMRPLRM